MKLTIKEGSHYTAGLRRFINALPWIGKRRIKRRVFFDANCVYQSADYNAEDVNKLFGLSFGFKIRKQSNGEWDFGTHWNSARFGWVWSEKYYLWKLLAYVYIDGVLQRDWQLRFPEVLRVAKREQAENLLIEYDHEMEFGAPIFRFSGDVLGQHSVIEVPAKENLPRYGQRLGFYFGGALVTPHLMSADIDWI